MPAARSVRFPSRVYDNPYTWKHATAARIKVSDEMNRTVSRLGHCASGYDHDAASKPPRAKTKELIHLRWTPESNGPKPVLNFGSSDNSPVAQQMITIGQSARVADSSPT